MSSFAVTSWKAKAGKQIRPLALPGDGGTVLKTLTKNIFDEYALNVFLPSVAISQSSRYCLGPVL